MKDLRSRLAPDDPLLREGQLSEAEARRLRERILAAKPAHSGPYSALMLPVAAMLLLMAAGSGWLVRTSLPEGAADSAQVRTRQFQFSTSGGTRILWTFNDNFELR